MQLVSKMPTNVEFESSVLKINERIAKQTARDNTSLCYEAAFKKPLFLKDSVFDDDLAAFKDESSPNILSTNGSSLSSLTIGDDDDDDDDDDYCDTNVPNRANLIDISKAQRPILARQWQRNFTDYVQQHESSLKQDICRVDLKSYSTKRQTSFYRHRGGCNFHKANIQSNVESNNRLCDDGKKLHVQDQPFERENICDCKCCCSTVKGSNCSRQNQDLLLQTKHRNDQYHDDESNDKIVYEEQLLDQCIRRGMAKITKKNVSDIKPFCWDLHHICLTTRAMLKVSDADIKTRSIK